MGLFKCTSCGNTCHGTATFLLYATLDWLESNRTQVKLKVFGCTDLYGVDNFKKLLAERNIYHVDEQGLDIESEDFDQSQSHVTMQIHSVLADWGPPIIPDINWNADEMCFKKKSRLSTVLHLDGCHMCRPPYPRDAMTVILITDGIKHKFDGRFDVIAHAATQKEEKGPISVKDYPMQIYFSMHRTRPVDDDDTTGEGLTQPEKDGEELTDDRLLELSKSISSPGDLNTLGINGLKIPESRIATHLQNHPGDINGAAFSALKEWRTQQPNSRVAYQRLCEALKASKMPYYIR